MASNSTKTISGVFDNYQKARVQFVQNVAELSQNPKNLEALSSNKVMALLRPLLLDSVPSIQHNAAQALGRLAGYSPELALSVVDGDILPQLVYSLATQNKFYKKAAAFVLKAVAKHSPQLALAVVKSGAIDALVTCLEEFDPQVKEGAASAIQSIVRHTAELSQAAVDAGAVPLLVACVQEPDLDVKRAAASALSDICKHSPELAQAVVDQESIAKLAPLISHKEAKLKRQVLSCLGQIAKHSVELAELVIEGEVIESTLERLKDTDPFVRKNAATLIRELTKNSPEIAALVIKEGGAVQIVDYVNDMSGNARLPGILAIGFISAFSEELAKALIDAKAIPPLIDSLRPENEDAVRVASAWSLEQIGKHSAEHAREVSEANALSKLLEAHESSKSSDDLKNKCKKALKGIIEKCVTLPALEPLIDSPPSIQQYVLHQFAKILPSDTKARKEFVEKGNLQKIQLIKTEPGSAMKTYIQTINNVYPEELVQYYSPGFSKALLSKLNDMPTQTPA